MKINLTKHFHFQVYTLSESTKFYLHCYHSIMLQKNNSTGPVESLISVMEGQTMV